ncbi:MAG: hypothetical protein ACFUZC_02310 [Chthoniobacteraceae bacterium]
MSKQTDIVQQLADIRKVPQLLFNQDIWPGTTMELRRTIRARQLASPGCKEIDFVINSPGGSPADAYRIIRGLRETFDTVNIVVSFWAKSAATLLALGGSKIIMNNWAEFGPIDIQVGKQRDDSPEFDYESALNDEFSLRLLESRSHELFKTMFVDLHRSKNIPIARNDLSQHLMEYLPHLFEPLLKQINPYKLGEKKRQLDISVTYANRILIQYNSLTKDARQNLVDYLLHDCPDHGYVVDYQLISCFLSNVVAAQSIGSEYADALDELSTLYMACDDDLTPHIGFIDPALPVDPPINGNSSVVDDEKVDAGIAIDKSEIANDALPQN